MNVKLFKKLIREAVIEALHEELPDIINETLAKQNKLSVNENRTFNFTSADIAPLPGDVRSSLMAKMGAEFGFTPPQRNDLKVIDKKVLLGLPNISQSNGIFDDFNNDKILDEFAYGFDKSGKLNLFRPTIIYNYLAELVATSCSTLNSASITYTG